MTPEEKAVIEAAERYTRAREGHEQADLAELTRHVVPCANDVVSAVRALRESRKPKPRWTVLENGPSYGGRYCVRDSSGSHKLWTNDKIVADNVCVLLNHADALNRAEPA